MAHNNSRDLGDKVVKAIQFVSNRDITIPVTDTKEEENQILFSGRTEGSDKWYEYRQVARIGWHIVGKNQEGGQNEARETAKVFNCNTK